MKYKLNNKNASCIMGHINNFFGLPTVIDYGMQERIIRHIDAETFKTNYTKETYHNIIPHLSMHCKWHHMLTHECDSLRKDAPLLFLSSKYKGSGIAIHVGDIVILKGSELIIKSIHDMKKLRFKKPHINKFTHFDYSEEVKNGELIQLLDRIISEYNWLDYDYDYCADGYREILKYLDRELSEIIYNGSIILDHWTIGSRKYVLELVKNVDAFIEYGSDTKTIENVFNFELVDKNSKKVLIKSSSLYDIGNYLYGEYKDSYPEEDDINECDDDFLDYEGYYDWSSGF